MPGVYQSHESEPDPVGAAKFQVMDIAGAVQKGMDAAVQMTLAQQEIVKNQHQIALDDTLAPFKIQAAKSQADLLEHERQVREITDSPERLRSKMNAEDARIASEKAKEDLQTRQINDATSLQNHVDQLAKVDRLVGSSPLDALKEMDAMADTSLRSNLAFQTWRKKKEDEISSKQVYDKKKVAHPGAWFVSQHKAGNDKDLEGILGMDSADTDTRARIATATAIETEHINFVQAAISKGGDSDKAESLWQALQVQQTNDIDGKIIQAEKTAKNVVAIQKDRDAIAQHKAGEKAGAGPRTSDYKGDEPPDEPTWWSEIRGDTTLADGAILTLDGYTADIKGAIAENLKTNQRSKNLVLKQKLADIKALRNQISNFRGRSGSNLTGSGQRLYAGTFSEFFHGVTPVKSFDEFSDIRAEYQAATNDEQKAIAMTKLGKWLLDFSVDPELFKENAQLQFDQSQGGNDVSLAGLTDNNAILPSPAATPLPVNSPAHNSKK